MSETKRAIKELKLAGLFDKDSDYGGMIGKAVQELLEVFGKQGHSGFSAQHTANIFRKLVKGETLTPITGKDNEWNEVGNNVFQNKRCSAVFKEGKNGKPYYLDAIVWQGQRQHDTFTGDVEGIRSRQFVKLPFSPKTFYVDVIGKEIKKDEWKYTIKNRKQLDKVFEYYTR